MNAKINKRTAAALAAGLIALLLPPLVALWAAGAHRRTVAGSGIGSRGAAAHRRLNDIEVHHSSA